MLIFVMLLVTMLGVYGIIQLLVGSPNSKEPAEEVVLIEETESETEPPTEPPTEAPTEPPPLVEYPEA